jgi:sodium transport system ATP-binding protein
MIQVTRLKKLYGTRTAISDVTFNAPDGAITGLLGVNGAGKTTSLKAIAGVLRPSAGQILIDGISPTTERVRAQCRLGALLDHAGVYPRLTTRENLAYFSNLRGYGSAYTKERIDTLTRILGLEEILDRQTYGFSQGERMKVALGRALLHSPGNLVLDEPTNGLDIVTLRRIRTLLKELRDSGMCIVFSSHVLEEVTALCDIITVISGGRVVASGSISELCHATRTATLEDAFMALTGSQEALCV